MNKKLLMTTLVVLTFIFGFNIENVDAKRICRYINTSDNILGKGSTNERNAEYIIDIYAERVGDTVKYTVLSDNAGGLGYGCKQEEGCNIFDDKRIFWEDGSKQINGTGLCPNEAYLDDSGLTELCFGASLASCQSHENSGTHFSGTSKLTENYVGNINKKLENPDLAKGNTTYCMKYISSNVDEDDTKIEETFIFSLGEFVPNIDFTTYKYMTGLKFNTAWDTVKKNCKEVFSTDDNSTNLIDELVKDKNLFDGYGVSLKGMGGNIDIDFDSDTDVVYECSGLLDQDLIDILKLALKLVRIIAPILLIILMCVDFGGAVISQDQDAMKKATSKAIKRVIAAVAIFFVPYLVSMLLTMPGISKYTSSDPTCDL